MVSLPDLTEIGLRRYRSLGSQEMAQGAPSGWDLNREILLLKSKLGFSKKHLQVREGERNEKRLDSW